jgi:hypothetical protein
MECEFYTMMTFFSPGETPRFLSELTANDQCSEAALRALEESEVSASLAASLGASRTSCAGQPSLAREALFALRVKLAEAALHRLQSRLPAATSPAQARVRLVDGGPHPAPQPCPPGPAPHSLLALPPPPGWGPPGGMGLPYPAPGAVGEAPAECLLLVEERQAAIQAGKPPPFYFGDNRDPARKKQNMAEFIRRRNLGLCFKCTQADIVGTTTPFLMCPRHGSEAVRAGTAATAPSVRRGAGPHQA